jgi:probable rRNA maturation factor
VSIEVNNESGYDVDEAEFAALARYVLDEMHVHPQTDLSILLVGTDVMTDLHVKWMDEPGPTDVLSFPMDELRPPSTGGAHGARAGGEDAGPEPGLLGDVVLCPQVAAVQAKRAGHSPQAELELLCVHGVLHLLGYDHADPEEEAEMFRLQGELLTAWRAGAAGGEAGSAPRREGQEGPGLCRPPGGCW